jgi:hypothetical protein
MCDFAEGSCEVMSRPPPLPTSPPQFSAYSYLSSNFVLLQIIPAVDTVTSCITLRVFEKGVLQGILGPTRAEVTGGYRKRHNAKLNQSVPFATYYWCDKIKEGDTEGKIFHEREGG